MSDKKAFVKDLIIGEHSSVTDAMIQLDRTSRKVLFLEREGRLCAAVSDGDIRRWILSKGSLDAEIKGVANYNPRFLKKSDRHSARDFMKKNRVDVLPIVDDDMHIVDIVFLFDDEERAVDTLKDIPVVIMAGGLGTRLYPYTKILPKPLIPIGDIPIVEHIINRFRRFGCKDFYLVVNYKKNMIKAYFNELEKDYNVTYIDEDKPLGTGGGLSLLKGMIKNTFILTNCDILVEDDYAAMFEQHKSNSNTVTMICSLMNYTIPYGVVNIGESGRIESMQEKPQMSFFTNTGMYFVEPKVIEELQDDVAVGFPDVVDKYRAGGDNVGVYPVSEQAWMDMGQFDQMEEMRKRLEKR